VQPTLKVIEFITYFKVFASKFTLEDYVRLNFHQFALFRQLIFHLQDKSNHHWSIERVTSTSRPPKGFGEKYFPLTAGQAVLGGPYDFIIIGTGIGGGVLAGDLFDRYRKLGRTHKILVVEKGDVLFHSHCLNTSRPNDPGPGRGQDNDAFFRDFRTPYNIIPDPHPDWNGGALYGLGGRSPIWGLFAPRPHDETLQRYFPKSVRDELIGTYFEQAETLMKLSLPKTKPVHYHLMSRLDLTGDPEAHAQWKWGRITSEFHDERNFSFSQGAYSPIDKLLEIAMAVPPSGKTGSFNILLNAQVEKLEFVSGPGNKRAASCVNVKDSGGTVHKLQCKSDGQVILCAGSVESAAILLRSDVDLAAMGGTHITDHDIYFVERRFNYQMPSDRDVVGPMKLQTYARIGAQYEVKSCPPWPPLPSGPFPPNCFPPVEIPPGTNPGGDAEEIIRKRDPFWLITHRKRDIALVNMSIDASSFLPWRTLKDNSIPKLIVVFVLKSELNPANKIEVRGNVTEVTIERLNDDDLPAKKRDMMKIAEDAINTVGKVLKVDLLPPGSGEGVLRRLELGAVAHELGSIPMSQRDGETACLDADLVLRGFTNVSVCDMSVLPVSIEVNPTLTLAALALRLSQKLLPFPVFGTGLSIFAMNQSEDGISVRASNAGGADGGYEDLLPGKITSWDRSLKEVEGVFVKRGGRARAEVYRATVGDTVFIE